MLNIVHKPRRPALLCLNFRFERLDEHASSTARLATAAWCLRRARESGWRVVHVHNHEPRRRGGHSGIIEGLQPLRDEPVHLFLNQPPFDCSALWDAINEEHISRLYLIGATYSRAGFATIASAHERRLNVTLIEDASLGHPSDGAQPMWLHQFASALSVDLSQCASAFSIDLETSERVFLAARNNVIEFAARRPPPVSDGGKP